MAAASVAKALHRSSVLTTTWVVITVGVIILTVNVGVMEGETVLGEQTDEFDFDGLPGAMHEFKVYVPSRAEDCYFQKVTKGNTVHVAFEVLRGGDRNLNMVVKNSQGQVLHAHHWQPQGTTELEVTYDDTYVVCMDNYDGGFSGKLVYLYLVVFAYEDWDNFSKEIEDIVIFAENATKSLSNVEHHVLSMRSSQSQARFHLSRDIYLTMGNARYVQNWSLLQCLVILATSVGQVVFVRRLFRTVNVTPTAKPRA